MSARYLRASGDDVRPTTKREIRELLRRIREDVRDMERALATDDLDAFRDAAEDASGVGGELLYNIADPTLEA